MPTPVDILRSELVVCILFFNKLEQTIESIESFLDSGVEINILDNGSQSDLLARLKYVFRNNPLVSVLEAGENKGVSAGRNIQIKNTTKKWLFFVDNDISIREGDWLTKLADEIGNFPIADIHVPRLFNVHENDWVFPTDFIIDESGNCVFVKSPSRFTNSFPGGASIISRDVFDEVGLYDEDLFVGFEDFELAIRAWKKGRTLLVNHVDNIELRHDHRSSDHSADRSTAEVRYSVDHITNSHSVINIKHGVTLDPNFHDWLTDQVKHLTGQDGINIRRENKRDHVLNGKLMIPRRLDRSGLTIFIHGNNQDAWLRLRSVSEVSDALDDAGVKVRRIGLFDRGIQDQLIVQARSQKLLEDVVIGSSSSDRLRLVIENIRSDWILWVGRGLVTPESISRMLQAAMYETLEHADEMIFHPERIFYAAKQSPSVQWIRRDPLDVLEYDQDCQLFPVFLTRSNAWINLPNSRSIQYSYGWGAMITSYLTELGARGYQQRVVPGSGVLVV